MSSSDEKKRRRTIVYFCILALISAIVVMSTYQITRREKIDLTNVADTTLFSKRDEKICYITKAEAVNREKTFILLLSQKKK